MKKQCYLQQQQQQQKLLSVCSLFSGFQPSAGYENLHFLADLLVLSTYLQSRLSLKQTKSIKV